MWLLFEFYLSTDIDNIKAAYPDYRKARNEMQELVRAQKNIERFFEKEYIRKRLCMA
jgi:superfamily II RNA helicase